MVQKASVFKCLSPGLGLGGGRSVQLHGNTRFGTKDEVSRDLYWVEFIHTAAAEMFDCCCLAFDK